MRHQGKESLRLIQHEFKVGVLYCFPFYSIVIFSAAIFTCFKVIRVVRLIKAVFLLAVYETEVFGYDTR